MTLLPVVGRELRVASRRAWNYWGRTVAATVAVGICGWIFLVEGGSAFTHLGAELFSATTFLAFGFALFAGVIFCADALSAERRDGTLGLLFLTDLKGYDVLLGKLAAKSLGAVFQLSAAVPVIAMCMLLGAVSAGEYLRMTLVLFSTLFLSLSVGMLASTLSADSKRSAVIAVGLLAAVCGLIPAIGGLVMFVRHKFGFDTPGDADVWAGWCLWATPLPLFPMSFDDSFKTSGDIFWREIGYVWVVALLSLLAGSLRVPHLWQEKALGGPKRRWLDLLRRWRGVTPVDRTEFRSRLLEVSPMVWLAGRNGARSFSVWMFLGLVAVAFLLVGAEAGKDWFEIPGFIAASMTVHFVFKIWIASEAPRQFMDDRRSGAMELLVSTPMTVPNLVHGRMLALRRQFEGPGMVVLAADLVFLLAGMPGSADSDRSAWVAFTLARMLVFVADAYALAWTGIWFGMRTRGLRSTLPVAFRILGVFWLIVFLLLTLFGLVGVRGPFSDLGPPAVVALFCTLGLIWDVAWILRSHHDLMRNFRLFANFRPGEKKLRPA